MGLAFKNDLTLNTVAPLAGEGAPQGWERGEGVMGTPEFPNARAGKCWRYIF